MLMSVIGSQNPGAPVSASLDPQPATTAIATALQHAAGRAADYARAAHHCPATRP
jgi:hypothetical protein